MSSKRTDIDDIDVWFMREVEGMTLEDIADYYGVTHTTIYYRLHPEKRKEHNERTKKWILDNPEKAKEYKKQWILDNPEKAKENAKQWRLEHPEYSKEWRQTPDGKAYMRKQNASRRNLDSIELNKPFPGSEGHHIDETYIIHIPKELHRSIWHNLKTGQGMEEINEIAFGYITEEVFDKLLAGEI